MRLRLTLLVALVGALASCKAAPAQDGPGARRAFYYWRTTFALSAAERTALTEAHVTTLYVRAFDLGWSAIEGRAEVLGGLTAAEAAPAGVDVVPVVYIKNEVFQKLASAKLPELAQTTWAGVQARMRPLGAPRELQLDCDWTPSTREAYFAFLTQLRAVAGVPLSATIRLHQAKFREKTGVPPVERGMLMFYNMGTFSAAEGKRAIFDAPTASQYLERLPTYPLPLDVALPIYSWSVQLRDDRVEALLQAVDPDELPKLDFVEAAGDDRFRVTRSAFLHGTMLREGDMLKIERMGPADTLEAAALVAPRLAPGSRTVSLFDLSERNLTRYGTDDLDHIFGALR